jgi:DNA-binding response OmpR family regulator
VISCLIRAQNRDGRILMVDQDLDLRVGLGLMLTSAGYEVSHTDNGNEAIAMHRCNPFDVVIVDMVLPERMASKR